MYPGHHAALRPDHPAIVMNGSGAVTTYAELERESARLARFLHQQGLRKGDGIVLVSPNDPMCLIAYWAAVRSGLYITALNYHLCPDEALAVLRNCRPSALIASAACGSLAAALAAGTPTLEICLAFGGPVPGCADYDEALTGVSTEPLESQPRGADMLYSSGTTGGIPKGIRPPLPDREVHEPGDPMVATFGPHYGFDEHTVYLSPAPLYHGGPLRFAIVVLSLGGTVVVLERFDAETALAAIDRHRCTHSQWVPTMFVRMLKLPSAVRERYDVSSMRCAVHASAPCPVEVKRAMMDWWGPVLEEYYASQEAAGVTMISSAEWCAHPGSVGRAVLGEIKICDDSGAELPPGATGTVYFARDEVPFVYHDDPVRTKKAQHPLHPSWTTPGDIGYVDEDGYLYLTDRAAFMIISGGVNIYPQEIEDELALHPAVDDVAVIGLPDDDLGERVTAFVIPAPGHQPGDELAQRIIDHLATRLARYKVPRQVEFVDELPRTPTGKLAKAGLIAHYRAAAAPTRSQPV
ncbi:acyl-CoA synthetase [Mycobacterium sp. NAZ190054]|uniref:acyl-CoA synthetase n=1 Tax=Mycobacterium sp. NAZ190054 TaxID=1747766 RepID=UPI0007926AD7|nr:acyl-CoA synthetase [Mycobacterium sp. NAZ190054]KWX57351.1 acyl-CoA synthetase [Mycobacterium sp. NAZ190054]